MLDRRCSNSGVMPKVDLGSLSAVRPGGNLVVPLATSPVKKHTLWYISLTSMLQHMQLG